MPPDDRDAYLQFVNNLEPSFKKPPKTRAERWWHLLAHQLNPLWWAWKGTRKVLNLLFGEKLGRVFFKLPLLEHNQRSLIVPQLIATEDIDTIISSALSRDAQRGFGYRIQTKDAVTAQKLKEDMHLGKCPLKTHDEAIIEHYWVAPKNLIDPDVQTFKNPNATQLVISFEGRSRHPLHCLPEKLLMAHEEQVVYASFAYRGLVLKSKDPSAAPISDHQYWLQRKRSTFKVLKKAKHSVYDGMAVVGHYLRLGFLPKNITLDCYSMGGIGIIVADRYHRIFNRFNTRNWSDDRAFLEYAQCLFGKEPYSKEDFVQYINELKKDKLAFNVFADRNYSTLSAASAGQKVITPLERRGWKKLAWVAGWLAWPFLRLAQLATKWEVDVLSAYQRLDPALKKHTGLRPAFPDHSRDTMVHEFAALSSVVGGEEEVMGYVIPERASGGDTEFTHAALPVDVICHSGCAERCDSISPLSRFPILSFYHLSKSLREEADQARINYRRAQQAEQARINHRRAQESIAAKEPALRR